MENYKVKKYVLLTIFFIILVFFMVMVMPYSRSFMVTEIYKEMNRNQSILTKEGIHFNIPSGSRTKEKDWFNQMIWFHDSGGFSRYMNRNLDMTVLYTYGAFNSVFGTSMYYEEQSPFYGAFYGGYAVRDMDKPWEPFGFDTSGRIVNSEIESIPLYDQKYLVLPALGCTQEKVFNTQDHIIVKDRTYAGYTGWTRVDSRIRTNGPAHRRQGFHRGYLQYGMPLEPTEKGKKDFAPQWFYGRMYIRYFEEYQITICLYVMCKDLKTVDACDKELLSKTEIGNISE